MMDLEWISWNIVTVLRDYYHDLKYEIRNKTHYFLQGTAFQNFCKGLDNLSVNLAEKCTKVGDKLQQRVQRM